MRRSGPETTMSHAEAEAGDLALLYLQGRLPPDEVARFEEHYLGCPECVEELELLERFDRALKGAVTEDVVRLGWWARLRRRSPRPVAVAAAASLAAGVLLVLAVVLGLRAERLEDSLETARAPVANPLVARLSPTRDPAAGASVSLHPRPGDSWVVLELDATALAGADGPLRATVRDDDGTPVLEVEGLVPGPLGEVTLALPVERLGEGDYRLEVRGDGGVLRFPFRLARADPASEHED